MRNPFLQVIFFIRGHASCGKNHLLMVDEGKCAWRSVRNAENGLETTIMCGSAFYVGGVLRSLNVCPLICECKLSFPRGSHVRRNSSMPQCSRCGNFHATPRQNKNCERRSRSTSTPAASGVQAVLPQKFDESAVYSAYLSWKSLLEEESVDNLHN